MKITTPRRVLVGLVLLLGCFAAPAQSKSAQPATLTQSAKQPSSAGIAYSLPPDKLERAVAYSRTRVTLNLLGSVWGIVSLFLLLQTGVVSRMQQAALRAGRNRWLQGAVFSLLLLIALTLLNLPLDLYAHHAAKAYGQSVQSWGSWTWDMTKGSLLTFAVGLPMVMLLFWTIRRSPQRWWFWFWVPAMLLVLLSVFIAPILIDPLFNSFEPLARTDPALVDRLEKVVDRAGVTIPPSHMFVMKASEKVTTLNAYVTGYGASKRVVVWDNTIARATPDEISLIFGHELGHYVLNHIPRTLGFLAVLLLATFYLGFKATHWLITRYGSSWGLHSPLDWGTLAVILLVISVLSFLTEPVINGFSRSMEHDADIYGQEVVHGIVANPQQVAQQSFQLLGEVSLSDPNPHPFIEFWLFSHPSISRRAQFGAEYNPWMPGGRPKFFGR